MPPAIAIDAALIRRVAKLASLSLSDDEATTLTGELARIVAHVAQLDRVDTTGIEPTAHVLLERAPWRADEPRPCLTHEEALGQAPATEAGGFSVPAFVENK